MIAPANFVTELRNPFLRWNSDALTVAVLCAHAHELVHELPNLPLRKNLGAVLEVEVDHFLCREHWAVVLVRSSDHGREQSSCARSRNHIKVVRDPGVRSIQFLNPHNINTFHCMDRFIATGSWGMHAGRKKTMVSDLKLGFEKGNNGPRNEASNASSIDAQHRDQLPLGGRRRVRMPAMTVAVMGARFGRLRHGRISKLPRW